MKAFLFLLALFGAARADDAADAEAMLRAHFAGVLAHKIVKLTPDARLFSLHGKLVKTFAEVGPLAGKLTKLRLGIPTKHEGWFHAEITGGHNTFRVIGVFIHEEDWKVEAELFTQVVPEKVLRAHPVPIAPPDDMLTSVESKQIDQVLPHGLHTWLSHDGVISGPTLAEYADTPDEVDDLVQRWDLLPITWKNHGSVGMGSMSLVHGEVQLQHDGKATTMTIALVGHVPAGTDRFTWLAIAFGAP